jgi:tripartite-type tricarboxylate transporter receptor subunit TctC
MPHGTSINRRQAVAVLAGAALAVPGSALAQSAFPNKPIKILVGFAPGGPSDLISRVVGAKMGEILKTQVVVENKPGAGGMIAAETVARSDPDGYTLVYSPGSSMMIAPHIVNRPDLDPTKALVPVVPTGRVSLYVITHPKVPVSNYAEFAAFARANPGKLNYGTPGNGTSPHIATEVYAREAKVKLNHVPYKGAGPALNDLLAGVIDLMFDPGPGIQQARTGKVKMIAIAGPKRHPDFPDVPTLEENGIKGVDGGPHFGFYAPAGTPNVAIERLNREVIKVMQEPQVLERFRALAVDLAEPMTPQQFAAYVRGEHERYGKLLPELGLGKK